MIDRAVPPMGFAGIAGHVDVGESELDAVRREIKEESGLEFSNPKLLFSEELDWNWCSKGITVHRWYLFAGDIFGEIKQNVGETRSIGWYSPEEIQKLNLEPVWEYWFKKLKMIP